MNRTRHSFTCFLLFGTLWARELAPFLSPSHLQKGAVAPGDHFLLIDVDNCAKVLDFVESSVPSHVKIYGFCGAGYSQGSASPAFHRLTEKGIMHLIPCPVGTSSPGSDDERSAAERSVGGRAMADFFNAFYDNGCDRKYKNAADYLLSMFAGVIHVLFPMDVPIWILSHDDGLENTAEAVWCRGREAGRVPTKHITDHSLWTIVRHDALLRSAPLHPPMVPSSGPSHAAAAAAYVDGYGEGFLGWGLSEEATFGRGGSLTGFMDNAWTNHYDVAIRRVVPRAQYDALFPAAPPATGTTIAVLPMTASTSDPAQELSIGTNTRKRRQREDEAADRAQIKERNGHSPPKEKRHRENDDEGDADQGASQRPQVEQQHISFGERVSVQWNGSRYERSVLKKDHVITRAGDTKDPLPHHVVPAISLPASGHVNLTLRGHRFSSKGIALLGEVLSVPSVVVKSLDLRGNRLGDGGIDRLADLLCTGALGRQLTSLDIRGNEIDDRGTVDLARFLATTDTLRYFDLRWNKVGVVGARAVAQALAHNTSVGIVNLRENRLGMDGVMTLADFLLTNRSVYSLDLRANISPPTEMNYRIGESGDEAIKYLGALLKLNSTVTHLDLCSNSIGSEGAMALASALEFRSSLYILHLDFNKIDFAGVRALGRSLLVNQSLLVLTLAHNFLEDDAVCALAKALATNATLTKLDLQKNHVSNKGASALAEALKTNQTLTELYLSYNGVGDAGAYRLADALKHNDGLLSLELENNKITSRGGKAFASMLARNTTLRFFNLSGNLITDEGLTAISRALMSNRASSLLDLQVSGVDGRDECWDVLREMLRHNRRLLRLDVSSNPLYHPLCGRRPARFAVRDSSPDDDEALRSRWKDKRSFLRSSGGSGAVVPLLAISPPSPASVQAGGLMSPPQSAPARNRYQADGGNRHQVDTTNARHPHHHHQYHPHNRLRNTFLLEWLQLEPVAAQADEVSAAIAERSSHIELLCEEEDSEEDDDDGDERASRGPYNICRILEENTSLVWLVMANANLHMNSAAAAASKPKPRGKRGRRLARKAARERLETVDSNQDEVREDKEEEEETFTMDEELITDEDGEDQDAVKRTTQSYRFMRSLSRALARNGNLTSLDLSWNRLDAATIAPLAEALDNRRQANAGLSLLTTLVLRGNRLQDEGVAVLARSLLNNCTVTTLNLDTNRITDEGIKAVGDLVAGNEVLAFLSLVSNGIKGEGLLALGAALRHNRSIVKLSLERNPLEREAVAAFWQLLASVNLQRGPTSDVEFVNIGI